MDQDPEFPKGNSIYEVTALGEENATIGDPEAKTIRFNLNREPRFIHGLLSREDSMKS